MQLRNLSIRLATDGDSKDILEWRNDTVTRRMSHTTKLIGLKEHKNWFKSSLNSQTQLLLISENFLNGKIAFIRFDITIFGASISINMNPKNRGKKLAKVSLIGSIDFFLNKYPSTKNLLAEVNENNIKSKKIFLDAGFKKYKVYSGIGYYKKICDDIEIK